MNSDFVAIGDDGFEGTTGSGALAASSEADTWVSRNGPWHVDTTSPTLSASGSTSPIRHRGNGPLMLSESQKTSPYMTTSRPAIGQGPGITNRSQVKSSLDPASGSFKYPFHKPGSFSFPDDKENSREISGLEHYGGHRGAGATPRDNSQPPSRSSETAPTSSNGSFFANGGYNPSFGHTPNNSIHIQRSFAQGRNSSFLTDGRSFTDMTDQTQEAELNFRELQLQDKDAYSSNAEQSYPSPGAYSNYSPKHAQLNGALAMWNSGIGATSKGASSYSSEGYADVPFSDQLNPSKVSRAGDHGSISPSNGFRLPTSPKYHSTVGMAPLELESAYVRGLRPQSAADLERSFQRLQFAHSQSYFPPPLAYNGQYPAHTYDYSQNFRPTAQPYGYQIPIPPYTAALGAPRGPARDQDVGHGVRSALLEEFRSNSKSNKRYELKVSARFRELFEPEPS
jgi:mRNA-binding protein PUF3